MSKRVYIIILLLVTLVTSVTQRVYASFDISLNLEAAPHLIDPDSIHAEKAPGIRWEYYAMSKHLDIKDTTVVYPKFINFCLNVYRWAELNFNTYDPDFVTGTGKHGKVRVFSDNWSDSFYFHFKDTPPLTIGSDIYTNVGVQANYSILSLSYSIDTKSALNSKNSDHKKWGFSISTARLLFDLTKWQTSGETFIRNYGNIDDDSLDAQPFTGMSFRDFGILGIYIFDFRRYSHAAAYNLSNYQLRSKGSWMIGLRGNFIDVKFDFTKLPAEVAAASKLPMDKYTLEYNTVNVMGGYGYNWVINRHWLFNNTTLPYLGAAFAYGESSPGRKDYFSFGVRQQNSLTYTNRQFFMTANLLADGNMLVSNALGLGTFILNMQFTTGVRF